MKAAVLFLALLLVSCAADAAQRDKQAEGFFQLVGSAFGIARLVP